MALAPFAGRCVGAADQQRYCGDGDADERDDEGDAPGDMRCQPTILDEAIEDGGHKEVCDATTSIAESSSEGVCGTDNVLVEEAGGPDLTRDKATSQDANEESKDHQSCSTVYGTR